MSTAPVITRFAPSPTGALHLGHAYAALVAWREAQQPGGRFLLRMEDIDPLRARADYEQAILDDLTWLDLNWDEPVLHQSNRMTAYQAALDRLHAMNLLYPCFCSRADIRAEIKRADAAPHSPRPGDDEDLPPPYPGTCRDLPAAAARVASGAPHAWRLRMDRAIAAAGGNLVWHDRYRGETVADPAPFGDIIISRKETPTSYHIAVTLDDAAQGVTLVTRGEDLFPVTHVHRLLQALLDLPVPHYLHHPMVAGTDGRRLAKRDHARALAALRAAGTTPQEIRRWLNEGEARWAAGQATAIQVS